MIVLVFNAFIYVLIWRSLESRQLAYLSGLYLLNAAESDTGRLSNGVFNMDRPRGVTTIYLIIILLFLDSLMHQQLKHLFFKIQLCLQNISIMKNVNSPLLVYRWSQPLGPGCAHCSFNRLVWHSLTSTAWLWRLFWHTCFNRQTISTHRKKMT